MPQGCCGAAGVAIAAILSLALAIGANSAVFSVVDKVLLQPLPIETAERVVVIWPRERDDPQTVGEISHATFRSWQGETTSFDRLAVIGSANWTLILQEGDPATLPEIAAVSASFFPTLGASAAHGRVLRPEDDARGAERVLVISHRSWMTRFAGDPAIVGRALRFKDAVYTVGGCGADGFEYPRGAELSVRCVRSWWTRALSGT